MVNVDAVSYVNQIADCGSTVSINNSGIINQELAPKLTANGFTVINSHNRQFDIKEKAVKDYWDLPCISGRNFIDNFGVVAKIASLPNMQT